MSRASLKFVLIAGLGLLPGCSDSPVTPSDVSPQFAKPGPVPGTGPSQFDIPTAGEDLLGDGRGAYVNGVCGVGASIGVNPATNNLGAVLSPAASTKGLPASCGALRAVTLRLGNRHLGYDGSGNHIDDTSSSTVFQVNQVKIGEAGVGVINSPVCLHLQRNGSYAGVGMRFQSPDYPGSSDLIVNQSGPGNWHVTTQPYPNNMGYCNGDAGISYWHVDIDLTIAPK